jgi:methylmalonyl-CoA/ethylmalonyl-CoA epimerase
MTAPAPPGFASLSAEVPGFLFVDHVAIAVPRGTLEAQVAAYGLLGFREVHREEIHGSDHVREALLRIGDSPNLIQLIEPLDERSPVHKAIERNGGKGGLNHVGFRVRDVQAAFAHLKARGFRILDAAPRPGSRGTTVFFMHPKALADTPFDVLIEVVQDPAGEA